MEYYLFTLVPFIPAVFFAFLLLLALGDIVSDCIRIHALYKRKVEK